MMIGSYVGALGHGLPLDEITPRPIEFFAGKAIKHITTGSDFGFAVSETNEVFSWGECDKGVIGDGVLKSTF